jgi:hypothetical protein
MPDARTRSDASSSPQHDIDWHRAADLVAGGASPAETARLVGCSPARLSRRLHHDAASQAMVAEAREPEAFGQPSDGPSPALLEAIEREARSTNIRVSMWLSDRLKLLVPIDDALPDTELRSLLMSLTPEELAEFEALKDPK